MFTGSMSHKEIDFVSYFDSKFAERKEKFVKVLKEDLQPNINNEKLSQNLTILILQNNVLNEHCFKMHKDIKYGVLEQYSRHQCLPTEGILKPYKRKDMKMLKILFKNALLKPMLTFQILS